MFWAGTHLELVFVVVGDDRDPEVTVLAEQWSSLQLGAHLDLNTITALLGSLKHLLSPHCW